MAKNDSPEAALQLARAIAGDINLYNEDKIIRGIEQDNLFEALEDEIAEGLELYQSRVEPHIVEKFNFFRRAVVDEVLKRRGHIKSRIW